jgi:hypothetical protein
MTHSAAFEILKNLKAGRFLIPPGGVTKVRSTPPTMSRREFDRNFTSSSQTELKRKGYPGGECSGKAGRSRDELMIDGLLDISEWPDTRSLSKVNRDGIDDEELTITAAETPFPRSIIN